MAIIETIFFPLILIFTHWHNYFMARFYPRWLHLTPYYFGIGGLALIIVIHCFVVCYKEGRIQQLLRLFKSRHFLFILAVVAEIHIVQIIELIQGKSYIFHVLDFAVYDVILVAVFMMCYALPREQILRSLRWMSLAVSGFALFGWIQLAKNGFTGHMYAGMDNPQTTGMVFLIGFWLPTISKNKWVEILTKFFLAFSVLLTWERSCWVGLFLSLGAYLVLHGKKLWSKYSWHCLIPFVVIAVVILSIPGTRTLLFTRFDLSRLTHSTEERLYPQREFIGYFLNEAGAIERIFGNGYDTAEDWMSSRDVHYSGGSGAVALDNQFLKLLFEFGIIGFILYILWFLAGIFNLKTDKDIVKTAVFIIIAMLVPSLFYDLLTRGMTPHMLTIISGIMLENYMLSNSISEKI